MVTAHREKSGSGLSAAAVPADAQIIGESLTDPQRFAVLYDRHATVIHRYCAQRLGTQTADDLMAETFAVAFTKRKHYDLTRDDARPWLFGIAGKLIARHRDAEVRRYRLAARVGREAASASSETTEADSRLTAWSLPGPLAAALAELPRGHRDVLLLIAWADLSYEEAAITLGVPVGTVRSRLSRARRRLRKILQDSDPDHQK